MIHGLIVLPLGTGLSPMPGWFGELLLTAPQSAYKKFVLLTICRYDFVGCSGIWDSRILTTAVVLRSQQVLVRSVDKRWNRLYPDILNLAQGLERSLDDFTGVKIIDTACRIAYNEGMNSTQYTIRSIPPKLDVTLRRRAQKSGKSLNEILIETLAIGAGVSADVNFDDLDWFIGNKALNGSFSQAIDWLDAVPREIQ